MDSIRQIAKDLNTMRDTAEYAAAKVASKKRVERATDTFDHIVPYEMEFKTTPKEATYLTLYFKPPAPSACCGTCYCSVCEDFSGNVTVTLTYGYISGTLNVFVNDQRVTDYEEIDPDAGTLKLNTTGEKVRICYIYYAGGCGPIDETPPPCTDTSLGVIHQWANRDTSYIIQRSHAATGSGTSDFRTTMTTTNNWATTTGTRTGSTNTGTSTRMFYSHTAPAGALSAHLRVQLEGWYPYSSFISGYTSSIPLQYRLRTATWTSSLPVWGNAGEILAEGTVNLDTGGLPVVSPGAPIEDVIIPVVGGKVRWVLEMSDAQTSYTGRIIDVTHAVVPVTAYPNMEADREYFPQVLPRLPGNTTPIGAARDYYLEFYSTDCSEPVAGCNCVLANATTDLFDDFNNRTISAGTGTTRWGLASSGRFTWTTAVGTTGTAEVTGTVGNLTSVEGSETSASLVNIHLKGEAVIAFDYSITSTGGSFGYLRTVIDSGTSPTASLVLFDNNSGTSELYTAAGVPAFTDTGTAVSGAGTCYLYIANSGITASFGETLGQVPWTNDGTNAVVLTTPFDIATFQIAAGEGAIVNIDNVRIYDSDQYGSCC